MQTGRHHAQNLGESKCSFHWRNETASPSKVLETWYLYCQVLTKSLPCKIRGRTTFLCSKTVWLSKNKQCLLACVEQWPHCCMRQNYKDRINIWLSTSNFTVLGYWTVACWAALFFLACFPKEIHSNLAVQLHFCDVPVPTTLLFCIQHV